MDRFNNVVTIKGQRFCFHSSVETELLQTIETNINEKGFLPYFNQTYGRIANNREKKFRKILNAIIRAKNNPINANRDEIRVKLNDRNIKLKPILFKG